MINVEELKRIGFLRNLGDQHTGRIAALGCLKEVAKDAVVFEQGEDSSFIYLVLSGTISLQIREPGGESVEVATVGPGGLLGWSPALERHGMTSTARATSPSRLAALEVRQVLDLCEREPRFGVAFLRQVAVVLASRLFDTRRNLARALSHQPPRAIVEGSD